MNHRRISGPFFLTLLLGVTGRASSAQSFKLSGPLAESDGADSRDFAFTPDGTEVVYAFADGQVAEIHVAPLDRSSSPISISPPGYIATGPVRVTADGARALFQVQDGTSQGVALFSSRLDGSEHATVLKVTTRLWEYRISPDGSHAVFVAEDTPGVAELFSAPVDHSTPPVRLNPPLVVGGDVQHSSEVVLGFAISPDGAWVAYRADQDQLGVLELYGVPLDGSQPARKLSAGLPGSGNVNTSLPLAFAAGNRVIFVSAGSSMHELYGAPVDGSQSAQRLCAPLVLSPGVGSFSLTADGAWVLYTANQDAPAFDELYRVPSGGGAETKLSAPLVTGGDVRPNIYYPTFVESYALDPTGTRVVYVADGSTNNINELYSVPWDGSRTAIKLSPAVPFGGGVQEFRFSASAQRVVLDLFGQGVPSVYSVPFDRSSPPVLLSGTLTDNFPPVLEVSPDGQRVAFTWKDLGVFSAPIDGSAPFVRLSVPLTYGGRIGERGALFAPSGSLAYAASRTPSALEVLYGVPADGSDAPVKLCPESPVVVDGDVRDFAISPDGHWAAYRADGASVGTVELHGTPTDGSQHARRIARVTELGGNVHAGIQFHPSASDVFFVGNLVAHLNLHRVPADGSQDPFIVNGPWPGDGAVLDTFKLTPTGDRALYLASPLASAQFDLWSVPTDGSRNALRMSNGMPGNQDVLGDFLLTADGSQVVFRLTDTVSAQLYSARVNGSQPLILLSAITPSASRSFALTPDGARTIFRSDTALMKSIPTIGGTAATLATGNIFVFDPLGFSPISTSMVYLRDASIQSLYTIPVDGSGAPTRLDASQPALGNAYSFQMDADRTHTVYLADLNHTNTNELFVVPTAGGAVLRLSGSLVSGGNVVDYRIGGGRVVYLADQDTNGTFELYSVPIGGGSVVRLSGPLVAGGDVNQFQISPDGQRVVYSADAELDDEFSLFATPIDGSAPAQRLNKRPVGGGDVSTSPGGFQIAPSSDRVLYIADLDQDEVFELYASYFVRKVRVVDR